MAPDGRRIRLTALTKEELDQNTVTTLHRFNQIKSGSLVSVSEDITFSDFANRYYEEVSSQKAKPADDKSIISELLGLRGSTSKS